MCSRTWRWSTFNKINLHNNLCSLWKCTHTGFGSARYLRRNASSLCHLACIISEHTACDMHAPSRSRIPKGACTIYANTYYSCTQLVNGNWKTASSCAILRIFFMRNARIVLASLNVPSSFVSGINNVPNKLTFNTKIESLESAQLNAFNRVCLWRGTFINKYAFCELPKSQQALRIHHWWCEKYEAFQFRSVSLSMCACLSRDVRDVIILHLTRSNLSPLALQTASSRNCALILRGFVRFRRESHIL